MRYLCPIARVALSMLVCRWHIHMRWLAFDLVGGLCRVQHLRRMLLERKQPVSLDAFAHTRRILLHSMVPQDAQTVACGIAPSALCLSSFVAVGGLQRMYGECHSAQKHVLTLLRLARTSK